MAVAIGADPATTLAAVAPLPDAISEFQFAGLLRGAKTRTARCLTHDLVVPATSEIVLEGYVEPDEMLDEGPFGDHTGYYNSVEKFPVFTIERITHRAPTRLSRDLHGPAAGRRTIDIGRRIE